MIKLQKSRKRTSLLDMTPMVDCVFQLTIFFVLTSGSIQHSLEIDLPRTRAGTVREQQQVVVSILRDDTIQVDREAVAPDRVTAAIEEKFASASKRALTIEADRGVPFGVFARVLDMAKAAGAEEISLATDLLEERTSP